MALSIQQLDMESVEFLPAREVMTKCGGGGKRKAHFSYSESQTQNNVGLINVVPIQVGDVSLNLL